MITTRDQLDDIALAIADTHAMNSSHDDLLDNIRSFDSARNALDAMIDDYRDELDDDQLTLMRDNYDTLMMMLATRLLDFLTAN